MMVPGLDLFCITAAASHTECTDLHGQVGGFVFFLVRRNPPWGSDGSYIKKRNKANKFLV